LIEAYELSDIQANDILDIPLRRLTRLSVIELQAERDRLQESIRDLQHIVDHEDALRALVSNELAEAGRMFGTPRRTILLAGSGVVATPTGPLEVPDQPCRVLLSSTGLLGRIDAVGELSASGPRATHDVIVASIMTTTHAEFGVLTSRGRLVKHRALDLPSVPLTANAPNLQGGSRATDLLSFEQGERPLGLCRLDSTGPSLALGTRRGVVKRVNPEVMGKDSWEVIRLDDGDEVVGAIDLASDDIELVFITSQAQLLHFPAATVRPQGRTGGGVAGIRLDAGGAVIFFGASSLQNAVVVTVSGSATALPGAEPGSIKLTPFEEYPVKGRATTGVRCHRFLKGEDALILGWAGPTPAVAAGASGAPIDLPPANGRRDGSGIPAVGPISAVSTRQLT